MHFLSEFFGIKVYMSGDANLPPHFQAQYGDKTVFMDIKNAVVIKGVFPLKELKLVVAWCEIHRDELLSAWESLLNNGEISEITPLQ